jgi:hypothetical protein
VLVATRITVRELDPPVWCNAEAHRNPSTCATLYGPVTGTGELRACEFRPNDGSCRMSDVGCVEDRY